jgi:hypothetical protein
MVRQQGDKICGCNSLPEDKGRTVGNTCSGEGSRKKHLRVVRCHANRTVDHMRLAFRVRKRPIARRDGFAEGQPRRTAQFFNILRQAISLDEIGRCTEHHAARCQTSCDEIGVREGGRYESPRRSRH